LTIGPPRLLFTMNITFTNGDMMQVLSDETRWSQAGFNDRLTP